VKAFQEEGEVSREVLVALRRIIRAIDIHSRRLSKEFGLTGPQLLLLNEIDAAGQMLVGTLAKKAHLSQATVTTVIDRLEARKLVTRRRDADDKRRVWVTLTPEGVEILLAEPKLLQDTFLDNLRALETEEQQSILSSLQSVARMMDAEDLPVMPVLAVGPIAEPEETEDKA